MELGDVSYSWSAQYGNSRAGVCAKYFLNNFSGYLQVDGYAAYEQTAATLVGCWA